MKYSDNFRTYQLTVLISHAVGLVVISHGLGDTAEGFVDVAEVRDFLSERKTV